MEGASHYCAGFVVEWWQEGASSIAVEGGAGFDVEGVLLVAICSAKARSVDVMVGGRMMGWDGAWVEGRVMGMVRGPA